MHNIHEPNGLGVRCTSLKNDVFYARWPLRSLGLISWEMEFVSLGVSFDACRALSFSRPTHEFNSMNPKVASSLITFEKAGNKVGGPTT